MTTVLSAVPFPDTTSVRLRVEAHEAGGNPVLWNDYYNFNNPQVADELDLWTVPAGTEKVVPFYGSWLEFRFPTLPTGGGDLRRPVSGLTVGQRYRVLIGAYLPSFATVSFGVGGFPPRPFYEFPSGNVNTSGYGGRDPGFTSMAFEFVATNTTHDVLLRLAGQTAPDLAQVFFVSVSPITAPVNAFETYMRAEQDALWTFSGAALPSGVSRTGVAREWGTSRSYGMELENTSGTPFLVPAGSQFARITLPGLTPGDEYTARVYYQTSRFPYERQYPRVVAAVDGVAAADPVTGGWVRIRFTATAASHVLSLTFADAVTLDDDGRAGIEVSYVRLDAEYSGQDAYRLVSLTRSDANGTRPVRLFKDQDLIDGLLIVTDYEPASTGLVRYDVVTEHEPSGAREQSNASTTFDELLPRPRYRIAPAPYPQQSVDLTLITGYEATRPTSTTVADVIGRADWLVSRGVQKLRAGRLELLCASYADALAVVRVFRSGASVFLRQPDYPGMDMYFTVTRTDERPVRYGVVEDDTWTVGCDYVEENPPTGPVLGSVGWTIGASSARNPTFAASQAEFPTVLSLLVGPVGA